MRRRQRYTVKKPEVEAKIAKTESSSHVLGAEVSKNESPKPPITVKKTPKINSETAPFTPHSKPRKRAKKLEKFRVL
jgi:hypothetical protein